MLSKTLIAITLLHKIVLSTNFILNGDFNNPPIPYNSMSYNGAFGWFGNNFNLDNREILRVKVGFGQFLDIR